MNTNNEISSGQPGRTGIGRGPVHDTDVSMQDPSASASIPPRSSKRRAEETFHQKPPPPSPAAATLLLDPEQAFPYEELGGVSSRDVGVAGLVVSDFEQMEHSSMKKTLSSDDVIGIINNTNKTNNININSNSNINININTNAGNGNSNNNTNSYFCIGSGSGCVDRSVSQTCLTRELDQLPMNHREHVGQDLYGLADECIPNADESMLDDLEIAIVTLLEKADSKLASSASSNTNTNANTTTNTKSSQPPSSASASESSKTTNTKRDSSASALDLPITSSEPELTAMLPYHAYRLALSRNPEYVRNPTFRLMFLRATEGDTKKAAKRLTRHFKTKMQLFGEDKLVHDIVLDDLSADDMEALMSGGFQVLKKPDAAGRSVLFGRYTSMKYKTTENILRALWYIWMSILEDPINQMKGVVALGYEVGRVPLDKFDDDDGGNGDDSDGEGDEWAAGFEMEQMDGGFDRTLAREIVSVPLSVPARPVGYHLCTDSHQWVGILNMVMVTLCKFIRLRMRIHHGTDQECKYALMTHGMPTDCVPVDDSGYLSLVNHYEWIDHRKIIDAHKMTMMMYHHPKTTSTMSTATATSSISTTRSTAVAAAVHHSSTHLP